MHSVLIVAMICITSASAWAVEYVLCGLSTLVLVVGMFLRRRGADKPSAGAYAALAVGLKAMFT